MSTDVGSPNLEGKTRKISQSSRFEIEKVDEPDLNDPNKTSSGVSKLSEAFQPGPGGSGLSPELHSPHLGEPNKSSLKKTVKHFMNDDFFDLDSNQNTLKENNRLLETQSSVEKKKIENIADDDVDDSTTGCFQINYNERNQPMSIVLNLRPESKGGRSRSIKSCVYDLKTVGLYQKLIAEYLGTFILTLYACSIGLPIAENNVPSINGCLGGGLTLATLVWAVGHISGGHLNPAVTIAFLFTGKINPLLAILYVGSQMLGGMSGAAFLQNLVPSEKGGNLSVTEVHPDINLAQAFGVEAIITFVLVFTIFSCVDSSRKDLGGSFPLQIGLAVVVGGLFGGIFTGGSMNPARSFGPALITGNWTNHWIYWVGPITGAILAGTIYTFILRLKCPRKRIYHPVPRD